MMYMYFWLNYCDENHIERIPIPVKNIGHIFHVASEIIKTDWRHVFLLSDDTRFDDNEYLESLENGTELIVCTEEQIQTLSIFFELKRNWSLKNNDYPLNIDFFIWGVTAFGWLLFKINFDVHRSSFKQYIRSCSKCFYSLFIWLWPNEIYSVGQF